MFLLFFLTSFFSSFFLFFFSGIKRSYMNINNTIGQIKVLLKSKGYSVDKYSTQNIISTFARIEFNEEIKNSRSKTNCENWLTEKINSGSIQNINPVKKTKRKVSKELTKEKKIKVKGVSKIIKIPINYKAFLKTQYWHDVKLRVLKRDKNACVRCGSNKMLQVHHLTYQNHLHEAKHLNDLITLCNNCHKKEHAIN